MLEFRLLGDTGLWSDHRRVVLGARQGAVLAVLAFHANTVVSRPDLVRLVWGNAAGDTPATVDRLTTDYVSRLRSVLRTAGADERVRLVARSPGYLMHVDPACVDWHQFRDLVDRARAARLAADDADVGDLLRRGLDLWRGPALADLDTRSLDPLRTQMTDLRLTAAEDLAVGELTLGRGEDLPTMLGSLATAHPGRERLAALLIRVLHANGRRDDAIAVYRRTCAHLRDHLGIDPTDVLDDAYQAVLRGRTPTVHPATDGARLAQLPADTGSFTGRRAELARLITRPDDPGPGRMGGAVLIYAVDGMGGIGKTTLAVHAAHQLAPNFPDGCLFLDLHGFTRSVAPVEPGHALQRLLRALGVPGEQIPAEVDDQAALYRSRLAGKRMLIVLDNARTAGQVRPLLPAEPGCLVLVTSRRRLTALDEARPLSLDVLPRADAVALFGRIAGPRHLAGDPRTVERVVQLCGRLPLAVRIAAARLRARPTWTVAHLADRLADQHAILTELDDGERNIAAAFTLSLQELTRDQQQMLRLLGLHPGDDIDAYAAAALAAHPVNRATRLLEDLLDAHLLLQASPGRYRFHDLMRAYAADLAQAENSAEQRHAALTRLYDYYIYAAAMASDLIEGVIGHRRSDVRPADVPSPPVRAAAEAWAWLDAERRNLVAACAAAAGQGRPEDTIRLGSALVHYLHTGGHFADALAVHTHARSAAGRTGNLAIEAEQSLRLGHARTGQGGHQQAAEHLHQALGLFHDVDDPVGVARTLCSLSFVHWRLGHYEQAAEEAQRAVALLREQGRFDAEAWPLDVLGLIRWRQGRYDEAAAHLEKAVAICRRRNDLVAEAWELDNLGAVRSNQGRHVEAVADLERSITLFRDLGNRDGEGYALNDLGVALQRQGRHAQAATCHEQAAGIFRQIGDRAGESQALNGLGFALHATGNPRQAHAHHTAALALASETGDPYERARSHDGIAHTHHTNGDHDQSRSHWQQALAIYTDLGVPEARTVRIHVLAVPVADPRP